MAEAGNGSYALAPYEATQAPLKMLSPHEALETGKILAAAQFFSTAKDASKAAAVILMGQEFGLPPMAALKNIYAIDSENGVKFQIAASTMLGLVRKSGRYDYKIIKREDKLAQIEFQRIHWEFADGKWSKSVVETFLSQFDYEDAVTAQLAGKPNYRKWPKAMLFARAASQGVNAFCPDVLMGSVYAEGELDGPGSLQPEGPAEITVQARVVQSETSAGPRFSPLQVAQTQQEMAPQRYREVKAEPVEPTPTPPTSTPVAAQVAEPTGSEAQASLDRLGASAGIRAGDGPLAPDGATSEEEAILGAGLLPLTRARGLVKRITALGDQDTLEADDAKAVNGYLKEILPGDAWKTAWKAVLGGELPAKGAKVTKSQVIALAKHLTTN